jgi:hypothetical protein
MTAQTWHFHVALRMPELSQQEEVRAIFKEILVYANVRLPISGLEQPSLSYEVPDNGIAKIDGYLHVNKTSLLADIAVRPWIFDVNHQRYYKIDDRIIRDIIWTPFHWRQHLLIRNIVAACDDCDGGTESGPRRLEDWVGTSSEVIDRGGSPRQNRALSANRGPAENGGSVADPGGALRRRAAGAGRPGHRSWRRTPPHRRPAACSWMPSVQCAPY